jgi:hypothetical protein
MSKVWVYQEHWVGEGEGWDNVAIFSTEKKCLDYANSQVENYLEEFGEGAEVNYCEVWSIESEDENHVVEMTFEEMGVE